MELAQRKCVPCEGGVPPLEPKRVHEYCAQLKTGWLAIYGHAGEPDSRMGRGAGKLRKEFTFKDFKEAMGFVNNVAQIAESEGHHPDIRVSYNRVTIELTTHAIGGLSENDFILAAKLDLLRK